MKVRIVTSLGAIAGAVLLSWAFASPAAALDGKALYESKGCLTCHGPDGAAPINPTYPKLKGQSAAYMAGELKAFRSGERKGPQTMLMQPMALTLTDEESEAIANYLQNAR